MDLKSLFIALGTVFWVTFFSGESVFYNAFGSDAFFHQTAEYITENTQEASLIGESTTAAPAKDYSYPQEYICVDNSYFEKAVFLGDSRMQGFIKYCGIAKLRAYAYMGLTVEKYFSEPIFKIGDSVFSASQALELDHNFDKAYLMFGTNELGWAYPDIFIRKYAAVIQHIRECNPDAVIFVCSVIPVDKDAYTKRSYLKNETVWTYNEMLKALAEEEEAYFLDFATLVADENGALPSIAATDGIHLNREYVELCFDYIRSHAIEVKPREN